MLSRQDRWQGDLFVACSLRDLVPDDHVLRKVDRILDLSWLRDEVKRWASQSPHKGRFNALLPKGLSQVRQAR